MARLPDTAVKRVKQFKIMKIHPSCRAWLPDTAVKRVKTFKRVKIHPS
jgi:phage terminase small subunit